MKDLRGLEGVARVDVDFRDAKLSYVTVTCERPVAYAKIDGLLQKQWKLLDVAWTAPASNK